MSDLPWFHGAHYLSSRTQNALATAGFRLDDPEGVDAQGLRVASLRGMGKRSLIEIREWIAIVRFDPRWRKREA